jgi:hypothetical protein
MTSKYAYPNFVDLLIDEKTQGKDLKIIGMKHDEIRFEVIMIIGK